MSKKFDRKNSMWCIEYWIHRGYTEEEAKIQISKRQSRGRSHFKDEESYQKYRETLKKSKNTEEYKKRCRVYMKEKFTPEYWVSLYGEHDGRVKYEQFIAEHYQRSKKGASAFSSKSKKEIRESNGRCKEHWIKLGYSEEEAIQKVSEVQCRNKEYFVKKYGEKEGTIRWEKKIKKWKKSFFENDMTVINEKRKKNSHIGLYTTENIQNMSIDRLNVYLLRFFIEGEIFLKYGITKHAAVSKRWGMKENRYEVLFFKSFTPEVAVEIETKLRENLKDYHYSPTTIKTKEAIVIEKLNEVQTILGEYLI